VVLGATAGSLNVVFQRLRVGEGLSGSTTYCSPRRRYSSILRARSDSVRLAIARHGFLRRQRTRRRRGDAHARPSTSVGRVRARPAQPLPRAPRHASSCSARANLRKSPAAGLVTLITVRRRREQRALRQAMAAADILQASSAYSFRIQCVESVVRETVPDMGAILPPCLGRSGQPPAFDKCPSATYSLARYFGGHGCSVRPSGSCA
jgi:hypothetical protein